jgi:hypothetical protein
VKTLVRVCLGMVVCGVLIASSVRAQAPTPTPPAVAAPKDELVEAWLDTAKIAAQLANAQCAQLDSVKQFQRVQGEVAKKVEARLPGYTVNWQTFSVERVKPAAPPAAK